MPETAYSSARRTPFAVIALCWVIVVLDGYDLLVYGTALPRLLDEPGWHLTGSSAGLLGSLAFLGMLVGAVLAGTAADRLGRRRTILGCTACFSIFTALCAFAPTPEVFGALRFLAGLGLGGLVPSASTLVTEFVGPRHRSVVSTLMMSGVPIGGIAAALVGIGVLPRFGWRAMFLVALLGVLVVMPLCLKLLPESPLWLRSRGEHTRAAEIQEQFGLPSSHPAQEAGPGTAPQETQHVRSLLRAPWRAATVLFSLATAATLFAWYGLATWLPHLMRESGFDLGSSLAFLLALSAGAVLGSLVTAWGATRIGPVPAATIAAFMASAALATLLMRPPSSMALGALVLAGVGTHGTQCLIIAAVADHYPARMRGSALGFALGVGRIGAVLAPLAGGWLLAAHLGVNVNFLAFALAAAAAGTLLLICPRTSGPPAAAPDTASAVVNEGTAPR